MLCTFSWYNGFFIQAAVSGFIFYFLLKMLSQVACSKADLNMASSNSQASYFFPPACGDLCIENGGNVFMCTRIIRRPLRKLQSQLTFFFPPLETDGGKTPTWLIKTEIKSESHLENRNGLPPYKCNAVELKSH